MEYNPTKTILFIISHCTIFDKPMYNYVVGLKWVDNVKHLGNHLETNLREVTKTRMKKSIIIQQVNTVLVCLENKNDRIIYKVFNFQCVHSYREQAWYFDDKRVKRVSGRIGLSGGHCPYNLRH